MVHTQEGSFLYVCTKVEADSSIRSKVIRGSQNFEIGSVTLNLKRYICAEIQLGILTVKFYASSSIHC